MADLEKAGDKQTGQGSGKYMCSICGYVYDPDLGDPGNNIDPGTPFEELPEDWVCPLCRKGKDKFSPC